MKNMLFTTLLLVSCANADQTGLPTITINNTCSVDINGSTTPTALEESCSWAVNSDGTLNTSTINNDKIAVLIGKKITNTEMKEWNVENYSHCSFQSVGVKLNSANEPTSLSYPIKDLLVCSELHIDKKIYFSYKWN